MNISTLSVPPTHFLIPIIHERKSSISFLSIIVHSGYLNNHTLSLLLTKTLIKDVSKSFHAKKLTMKKWIKELLSNTHLYTINILLVVSTKVYLYYRSHCCKKSDTCEISTQMNEVSQCEPYVLWRYYGYPFFIPVIVPWFRAS